MKPHDATWSDHELMTPRASDPTVNQTKGWDLDFREWTMRDPGFPIQRASRLVFGFPHRLHTNLWQTKYRFLKLPLKNIVAGTNICWNMCHPCHLTIPKIKGLVFCSFHDHCHPTYRKGKSSTQVGAGWEKDMWPFPVSWDPHVVTKTCWDPPGSPSSPLPTNDASRWTSMPLFRR